MQTIKDVWGDLEAEGGRMQTYRPALVRLTEDVDDVVQDLRAGFASRRAIVEWEQRLAVRTFGQISQRWYEGLARALATSAEPVLTAVLLSEDARETAVDEAVVEQVRERFAATVIAPAYRRAFRHLRKDAGEYVEDGHAAEHDPFSQQHVAMRPALEELEDWQQRGLSALFDGLADADGIHTWGQVVQLATHGEISDEFILRCHRERSTRRVLLDETEHADRTRVAFAARFLVPAYNAGVSELAGRAGEMPEAETTETDPVSYS